MDVCALDEDCVDVEDDAGDDKERWRRREEEEDRVVAVTYN